MKNFGQVLLVILFCLELSFGIESQNPRVVIKTELGDIVVEIYEKRASITASNFLKYVDENRYEGACFYRIVRMDNQPDNNIRIEVIQGGLLQTKRENILPPIEHETTDRTGILHQDGIISMARREPGTASSEFFICIGDQHELDYGGKRNPDGQGFAAFGKVTAGMDVVKKIHQQSAEGQMLISKIMIVTIQRIE